MFRSPHAARSGCLVLVIHLFSFLLKRVMYEHLPFSPCVCVFGSVQERAVEHTPFLRLDLRSSELPERHMTIAELIHTRQLQASSER